MSGNKRKGFTSGERMIATEHDCHIAQWSGRTAGNFWCQACGHKFVVGDGYRWIYANGNSPSAGNFMVCDKCDIGNEKLIELRQEALRLLSAVPDEWDAAMVVAYQLVLEKKESTSASSEAKLKDLIKHMQIHSCYKNCGFNQMTTDQKELFSHIAGNYDEQQGTVPELRRELNHDI